MKKVSKNTKELIKEIQKRECFLCNLSNTAVIFENDDFVVVLEEYPAVEGHVIIAPKKHVKYLSELTEEEAKRLILLIRRFEGALIKIFNPFRLSIVRTGLSVEHFHFHLVPVPNEKMVWDFKYLKKDEVIEYSEKEKADLINKIKGASQLAP